MAQLKEGSIIIKATGDEIIATMNDIPEIPNMNGLMPISGGVLENYKEKVLNYTGSGEKTLNLSEANVFLHMFPSTQSPVSYTITNSTALYQQSVESFTLIIRQSVNPSPITFPANVDWQSGEIPDLLKGSKIYVLTFMTVDGGTNWLGMFGGMF